MVLKNFKPLKTRSFFIFGPRGVGKSTWIRSQYNDQNSVILNLLDPDTYDSLLVDISRFKAIIQGRKPYQKTVVVDEIQRIPKLLDIVHDEISKNGTLFVLSGSSARRLKQKGSNLMAGRASVYFMYPFSMSELGSDFDLEKALDRGLLPEAYFAPDAQSVQEYLKSYVFTYLEKEIQQEQWVRKIEPFRKFLQIAAQVNSKILNKRKIANQIDVEPSTVETYFEILEETLVAFRLPSFHTSIRKQIRLSEKFYFVDTGIVRALEKSLSIPMQTHSSYYGEIFETFIVLEVRKFIENLRLEWDLSYLQTRDGVEIDLVISRPQRAPLLLEIKSTTRVLPDDTHSLVLLGKDLDRDFKSSCPKLLVSQDPDRQMRDGIECFFYKDLVSVLSNFVSK